LKVVWWLYLLNVVVQSYVSLTNIAQLLAQRGAQLTLWSPHSIPLVLSLVAQLVIVRVLLEVAAIVISELRSSGRR